jgi:trans-aconitate 2-methyltransferase
VADWSGEEYAKLSGLQRTMITEAMAGLDLREDDHVLDIGCGDGFLTRAIAGLAPAGTVVGADASCRMVTTAAEAATPGPSGPWFVVADARGLPFAQRFDAAMSFNALHWVPQQEEALRQIAAVLKPAGRVTIQVVCASARPSLESVAMQLTGTPRWSGWFQDFEAPFTHVDPDRFGEVAAAAGLTLDDSRIADREWDFGSREAFVRWSAMGSTAWTDRLPEDRRARFIDEQIEAYQPIAGTPGLFRFMQMRARLHREDNR